MVTLQLRTFVILLLEPKPLFHLSGALTFCYCVLFISFHFPQLGGGAHVRCVACACGALAVRMRVASRMS